MGKKKEGWTLDRMVEDANKVCGPGTCFTGAQLKRDPARLPIGVFALDYASGGGIPIWGTACFWGPESGAKTLLALKAAASCGRMCWECFNHRDFCECSTPTTKMMAFWADVEGTLDQEWAEHVGCNPEDYFVALADYGEQYANMADSALQADDCGLLVVDSLAAMTPASEMDQPAEDDFIALQARMITRMVRKVKQRLIRERKRGHPCAVIFTNQMRRKIVTFGDPETMPGGHGMMHEFSLLFRCVKKTMSKEDRKKYTHGDRKKLMATKHSVAIRKEKVLTLAGISEFVVAKEDIPDLGLTKGMIDDYNTVMTYARETGVVAKDGSRWKHMGFTAQRLDDIKMAWRRRPDHYLRTQIEVIKRVKDRLAGEET
jgi:recombination protein RecA